MDKYGTADDPYCYAGTDVLRNRLDFRDESRVTRAELALSFIAASEIEFSPPPYSLDYLQRLHHHLFIDVYDWAGQLRSIDISKGSTRFCTASRIEPEAAKIFARMEQANWYEGLDRTSLVAALAESFGDLNMIHPFREGNGRAQRILFEHLIANAGYETNWWAVEKAEWIEANIDAVRCDYSLLAKILNRCIGA